MGNRVYVCGDIGSNHMGKLENCVQAVVTAKQCGLNACKFQLGVQSPNIDIPIEYYEAAMQAGIDNQIDVFTSIFDPQYQRNIIRYKPKYMKFAYSQKDDPFQQVCLENQIPTIVSCDVMTYFKPTSPTVRLFCIPEYPVTSEISFDGIFPKFDGFSDHTMGHRQAINAVIAGAKFIEKHFKLTEDVDNTMPPDAMFALSPSELASMVDEIRRHE